MYYHGSPAPLVGGARDALPVDGAVIWGAPLALAVAHSTSLRCAGEAHAEAVGARGAQGAVLAPVLRGERHLEAEEGGVVVVVLGEEAAPGAGRAVACDCMGGYR